MLFCIMSDHCEILRASDLDVGNSSNNLVTSGIDNELANNSNTPLRQFLSPVALVTTH